MNLLATPCNQRVAHCKNIRMPRTMDGSGRTYFSYNGPS